jgi:hypothetical protein
MKTLHEMLKQDSAPRDRDFRSSEDLGRRYSKIGISAVAAAAQFNDRRETGALWRGEVSGPRTQRSDRPR